MIEWMPYIFVDTLLLRTSYLYPTSFRKGLKTVMNCIIKGYSHECQGHTTDGAGATVGLIMVAAPTLPKKWQEKIQYTYE